MRRTRRLTSNERWELGLFLSMLIVGFLLLTVSLNLSSLPKLFAFQTDEPVPALDTTTVMLPQDAPTAAPAIPAAPEPLPAPVAVPAEQLPAAAPLPAPAVPAPKPAVKKAQPDIKTYKGKRFVYVKTLKLRVTAYAPDPRCCFPYPGTTTASGLSVKTNAGRLVAADPNLIPLHSLVSVPGYANGNAVPVLDTGGAIKGHRLDVLLPTFDIAKNWGSKILEVKIYKPLDD